MRRCPQEVLDIHVRNLFFELSCSVVGSIFITLEHGFPTFLCRSQAFFRASSMFASVNSAQLPTCSHDRAFGLRPCSPLYCTLPKVGPFFSRFFTNRFATRASRNFLARIFPIFCKMDLAGIPDTPCRKYCSVLNFSDVFFLLCLGVMQCSGDCHRIGSPPALSGCLNAHLFPSLQRLS